MQAAKDALDKLIARAVTNWRSTISGLLTIALIPLGSFATIYHGPKTMTLTVILASVKGWNSLMQKD